MPRRSSLYMLRMFLLAGASYPPMIHAELRTLQRAIDAKALEHANELVALNAERLIHEQG